ncbi:MAG: S1C family serine protease [Mariniblastus sp.]
MQVRRSWVALLGMLMLLLVAHSACSPTFAIDNDISPEDQKLIDKVEKHRVKAINKVIGSVVAIYDDDRQGGGSGVIIHPSGIALTNHHVIMGSGVKGWGGLADGKMYRWKLIGTDPGGDVAIIQMEGKDDFPWTPLGDSDKVRVGDWALAMGNPFILTEDQSPTVTLGIVSGVKRYQYGAGMNQLVYGNCIQVDSSINPGNSGGPLFNLNGEIIGINGRGSFKERGRVNVGLGYAISSNQIKNFIPDLLATKLVEHATLDASFSDRDGRVLCSTLNLDSEAGQAGLALGDELLEFEGTVIKNANQFTNLICTLPEDWPTKLVIRKTDGQEKTIVVRTFGLPYARPRKPKKGPPGSKDDPEKAKQAKRQMEMIELLSADPGEMRLKEINQKYASVVLDEWKSLDGPTKKLEKLGVAKLVDKVMKDGEQVGTQTIWIASDGRFRTEWNLDGELGNKNATYVFDGTSFYRTFKNDGADVTKIMTTIEAKVNLAVVQALCMSAAMQETPFAALGELFLDGGDKTLDQNSYRLKLFDDELDPFFVWVRMYGDDGHPAARLMKAGADKDCADGGVVVDDWTQVGPISVPLARHFVSGLLEQPGLKVVNQNHEWLTDVDEEWFHAEDPEEVARIAKIKAAEEAKAKAEKEIAEKKKAKKEATAKAKVEKAKVEKAKAGKANSNKEKSDEAGEDDQDADDKKSKEEKECN